MTTQPEALRLSSIYPYLEGSERGTWIVDAAAELHRLYERNQKLLEALKLIAEMDISGAEDRAKALMADVMVFKAKEAYAKHGGQA